MRLPHLLILSLTLLAACGSPQSQRRLHEAERTLDTHGPITSLFHSNLYYPSEQNLQHDGYIIGIEKSPREVISVPADLQISAMDDAGLSIGKARDKLNDGKLLYISHIIESGANCAVYNLYEIQLEPPQIISKCVDAALIPPASKTAFRDSWAALDHLKAKIKQKTTSGKYSHILVIVMGWNTAQQVAVRNFNSIVNSLKHKAPPGFSPLVIGVTWPSMWANPWLDPIFKVASFPSKAADADELGLGWLGVLLHDTVQPAREQKLPVMVVGHSFGSRAASMAACVGPIIHRGTPLPRARLEHLINLQGAFLSTRMFGGDDKGIHFPERCPNVANVVLTASEFDTANNLPFWGVYAGDDRSYKDNCAGAERKLKCASADARGAIHYLPGNPPSHILYVDATALIRENAYGTGGGAHSDIYRNEHGAFLRNFLWPEATRQSHAASSAERVGSP